MRSVSIGPKVKPTRVGAVQNEQIDVDRLQFTDAVNMNERGRLNPPMPVGKLAEINPDAAQRGHLFDTTNPNLRGMFDNPIYRDVQRSHRDQIWRHEYNEKFNLQNLTWTRPALANVLWQRGKTWDAKR